MSEFGSTNENKKREIKLTVFLYTPTISFNWRKKWKCIRSCTLKAKPWNVLHMYWHCSCIRTVTMFGGMWHNLIWLKDSHIKGWLRLFFHHWKSKSKHKQKTRLRHFTKLHIHAQDSVLFLKLKNECVLVCCIVFSNKCVRTLFKFVALVMSIIVIIQWLVTM